MRHDEQRLRTLRNTVRDSPPEPCHAARCRVSLLVCLLAPRRRRCVGRVAQACWLRAGEMAAPSVVPVVVSLLLGSALAQTDGGCVCQEVWSDTAYDPDCVDVEGCTPQTGSCTPSQSDGLCCSDGSSGGGWCPLVEGTEDDCPTAEPDSTGSSGWYANDCENFCIGACAPTPTPNPTLSPTPWPTAPTPVPTFPTFVPTPPPTPWPTAPPPTPLPTAPLNELDGARETTYVASWLVFKGLLGQILIGERLINIQQLKRKIKQVFERF